MLTAAAEDGVFTCTRTDTGGHRRGWTLSPGEGWLFSVDNDNKRYRLLLEVPLPSGSWACLSIGGRLIPASSVGQDLLAATASFELTPAEANIISSRYTIPRRDRVRLDEGLQVRFEAESTWTAGGAMPVVLTLENLGSVPVAVTLGGRYRGVGRDNRFSFSVTGPAGTLPDIGSNMDFGGMSSWSVLAPGERLQIREDVARWATLPSGRYTVDCAFDLELSVPRDGFSMEYAHERWERTLTSSLSVEVLP
jgi:hypothetical protein